MNCACITKATRSVTSKIRAILKKKAEINHNSFKNVASDAYLAIGEPDAQGESLFAMAHVGSKVTLTRAGPVHVIVVRKDGEVSFDYKIFKPTFPVDKRSIGFHRSRGCIGVMQAFGTPLVFGVLKVKQGVLKVNKGVLKV